MIWVLDGLVFLAAGLFGTDLLLWWWRPEETFLALLALVTLRTLLRPYPAPAWRPGRALAVAVVAYAGLFSFITVTRHWAFLTHALDLGYYVQLLWSLSRELGARVSLPEMHAWGDHFSPTLYLFVPFSALFPGAEFLLVAQSVAFSLGALPVFALARRRLGSDLAALAFALLYLVSPTLHGINLRDFHAAALAIPLLLAAVYCFETGRAGGFLITVVLALGCREDAALAGIGLGLWIALARRRWLWGIGVAAGSLALLFFDTQILMPYFRGAPYPHLHRYTHLGGTLVEIILNMILHPLRTLSFMVSLEKLRYLLALLAPLGFLPLLAPWDLIPALPTLAHNLVSLDPVLFSYRTPYSSFILPFLVLAAVSGYARLSVRLALLGRPVRALGLGLAFVGSLALTSRTLNELAVRQWWPTERQRSAHALLAQVPPGASVSAWERFVSHLSTRPKVFVFPVGLNKSEYVVVDETLFPERDVDLGRDDRTVVLSVSSRTGLAEYRYDLVREVGGYLLLRRSASAK